eukprot:Hpha_TRINITY_DN11507_c0_g1::TRINITY_DN11507_c0_g1_i1::g.32145::m.32145
MGGEQSSLPCEGEWGFQVTLVAPGSPACDAGLVPFFDFIVHMDNFNLRGDHTRFFIEYMQRNKGQPVRLRVFNLKLRESREVTVTPRDDYGRLAVMPRGRAVPPAVWALAYALAQRLRSHRTKR